MPKNLYYNDIKLIKKPFIKRLKRFLKFFLICILIIGCFFCASFFSKALTVGNVSSLLLYGDKVIKISEKKHYAVTMGVYDTFEESRQVGLGLMIQGGSGYVWEKDNKFYVIGSIYSSKEDANKVIENIKNSNYDIDILDIKFSEINIKFDDYENKQVKEIEDALKLIDLIVEEVGSLAIRFDKSEINNFAVSSSLSDLRGDVKVSIATMQNILKIPNEAVNLIQLKLIKIDELLDSAIIQTIEKTENYFLKNINSQMYQIKYDLYQGLAK